MTVLTSLLLCLGGATSVLAIGLSQTPCDAAAELNHRVLKGKKPAPAPL